MVWYSFGAFESFLKIESSRSHLSLVHWKELPVQNSYFNIPLTKDNQMGLEQHEDEQIKELSFLCELILKQFSSRMLKLAVSAHLPFPEIAGLNIIRFSSRGNCCGEQFVCFAMKFYKKVGIFVHVICHRRAISEKFPHPFSSDLFVISMPLQEIKK